MEHRTFEELHRLKEPIPL